MEEANGAESRADFVHKVRVSLKEAREARYWLRICWATDIGDRTQCKELLREGEELVRILSSIIASTNAGTR
jgi:four helix bundle protein